MNTACVQCINEKYVASEKGYKEAVLLRTNRNDCEYKCQPEKKQAPVATGPESRVNTCPELRPFVVRHFAGQANASALTDCYMKLFLKETSCRPWLSQSADVPGNSYPGYGVCTIEKPPSVRAKRGPNCSVINTIDGQIRCCRHLMRSTSKAKSYFGPVRIGLVSQCE